MMYIQFMSFFIPQIRYLKLGDHAVSEQNFLDDIFMQ